MKGKRLIDLTLPLYDGCPIWSPEPKTVIYDFFAIGRNFGVPEQMNMKVLNIAGHAGTHCDAPVHLRAGKPSLDDIPLERFLGPASVVHLPHKGFADCIRTGKQPRTPGSGGRAVIEAISAAYLSAQEGRRVDLPLTRLPDYETLFKGLPRRLPPRYQEAVQ